MSYKKEMIKEFNLFSQKFDLFTVFNDFLIVASTAMSNVVDKYNMPYREAMYKESISKYNKGDQNRFVKLLALLTEWLENEPTDALGELFMELDLGNSYRGQYFTPFSVCKLMASISLNDLDKHINNKGYITLDEPACGSGATIIAAALHIKELGYNYQKQLFVNATDIDIRAVMMCYIQLTLLGIPAIVNYHNTLAPSLPGREDEWRTLFYVMNLNAMDIEEEEKEVS